MTDTLTPDDAPLWTTETLCSLLAHRDEEVRAWALERLTLLHPSVLPEVVPAVLQDPSRRVLSKALDAHRVSPTEAGREVLRQRLRGKGLPEGIRHTIQGLLRQGSLETEEADEDEARVVALAAEPARLRAMAPAALGGEDDAARLDTMMALRRRPERWAGTLVLEHLESLLKRDLTYTPWELLEEMGEVRALEPALRWHRPGEQVLATHIAFLARLAAQEDTLPPAIAAEAAERDAFMKRAIEDASRHDFLPAPDPTLPLRLSLRCRRCRAVGEYDVKKVWVDLAVMSKRPQDWDGVVLGRIVTCKWCGAVDDYELTRMATMTITSHLMLATMGKGGTDGPVQVQQLGLWDGTRVHRPSQALAHLQALAESRPTSGEAWRRLGNLRETYGQIDGAVAAWKEAIVRDPDEAEACYALAMEHDNRREPEVAFGYVRELFARQARQTGDWPLRATMLVEALQVAVPYALAQGRPLGLQVTPRGSPDAAVVIDLQALREVSVVSALFDRGQVPTTALTDGVVTGELGPLKGLRARPTPALLASTRPVRNVEPKVGRNDPCPCGSGKKFKKCCGP